MAKISFKKGDEYALKLSRLGNQSEEVAKKAVYVGAKIVADEIKKRIPEDTGDLSDSFGITPIERDKSDNWNAKLGFDGYDSKGVPNQLKARAIESGTSQMPKRPFVRPAVNATKKKAVEAMKKAIGEGTQKIMGGK